MTHENDVMRMRKVDEYDVKGHSALILCPMGHHIMLFGLTKDLVAGDTVKGTLVFKHAGEISVTLDIKKRSAIKTDHGHSH